MHQACANLLPAPAMQSMQAALESGAGGDNAAPNVPAAMAPLNRPDDSARNGNAMDKV